MTLTALAQDFNLRPLATVTDGSGNVQAATVIVAPPILNSRTQISNSPFGRHISSTAFFYTVRITLSEICF